MSALEVAVVEVASVLESFSLPYMLIGSLTVSLWGEARRHAKSLERAYLEPRVRELAEALGITDQLAKEKSRTATQWIDFALVP